MIFICFSLPSRYALMGDECGIQPSEQRKLVCSAISANPDVYTEAVLEKPPQEYISWIMVCHEAQLKALTYIRSHKVGAGKSNCQFWRMSWGS